MLIRKRNGSKVEFNKEKIENAILKAMKYGSGINNGYLAKKIASEIEEECNQGQIDLDIYAIENAVYNKLINNKEVLTAKAYEGYRAVQSFKREVNTTDESIFRLLNKNNEEVGRENSNKNPELASTQRDLIAGEIS